MFISSGARKTHGHAGQCHIFDYWTQPTGVAVGEGQQLMSLGHLRMDRSTKVMMSIIMQIFERCRRWQKQCTKTKARQQAGCGPLCLRHRHTAMMLRGWECDLKTYNCRVAYVICLEKSTEVQARNLRSQHCNYCASIFS